MLCLLTVESVLRMKQIVYFMEFSLFQRFLTAVVPVISIWFSIKTSSQSHSVKFLNLGDHVNSVPGFAAGFVGHISGHVKQ